MNILDLLILAGLGSAAFGGWRLGFISRAASWAGLGFGFLLAIRVLPGAVGAVDGPDPRRRLVLAAGVLLLGAFAGQGLGLLAASQLRRRVLPGPVRDLDRIFGGAMGAVGVLVSVWILLPSMAVVPGWPARQARGSAIARAIDAVAPEPPNTAHAVRRLVGDETFPRVFDALRPAPDTGPPPTSLSLPPAVVASVAASTVKVERVACRHLQQGSGWAVAADLVVTNAHVVAGDGPTEVIRPDGKHLRATVVAFDPNRDLAVLRVSRLGQRPLPMGDIEVGKEGAIFGHPDGQEELRAAPAAVRQRVEAVGRDLYDSRDTRRKVLILAASLHQGDSGGPLVDPTGQVVGVAFAIAPDRPGTAYALTTSEVRPVVATARATAVSTGPCLRAG